MTRIFDRLKLGSSQLRTVAGRRYDDAHYLRVSRKNKHANGAMYIGGFVLECLLKACLLERNPKLTSHPGKTDPTMKRRYKLLWSHDLSAMVEEMPDLLTHLDGIDSTGRYAKSLRKLCAQWTIFARYSPQTAKMSEAADFLDGIKELKQWLK